MENNEKLQMFPLFIGVGVLLLIFYVIYSFVFVDQKIYFYFVLGFVLLIIGLILYKCIKDYDFRMKTFSVLEKIGVLITNFGLVIIKKVKDGEKKTEKKNRKKLSQNLKSRLYARAEEACQYCGMENVKLHIHHIDKNPSNNNMNNLIVLCPNHHSIAESLNITALKNKCLKSYKKAKTINIYR